VVAPKGHPLLRKTHVVPDDIRHEDLILGDISEWGEYRHRLDDLFSHSGIALNPKLEASTTLALLGLVAAGMGITIYPESLIGFLGSNVEVRPIAEDSFRSQTILAWKRNNRAQALLNFVDIAKRDRRAR
jgi:DNA-binding transcriptional LysR family regulator